MFECSHSVVCFASSVLQPDMRPLVFYLYQHAARGDIYPADVGGERVSSCILRGSKVRSRMKIAATDV